MRVLYLIYWGATEPIGISGTVPTVQRLAREQEEEVFLVSFDKPEDRRNGDVVSAVRGALERAGVHWRDLGYTKRPANVSTAYDIARGYAYASWLVLRHRIPVVHARTYVGGLIGTLVASTVPGTKLVVHPDGFWPDERVDDGIWAEGSRGHRVARALERWMYRRADAVVVLSERARARLQEDPHLTDKPFYVVHTSCDESRFEVRPARAADEPLSIAYIGSLGGRRMTEEVFRFLAIARSRGARCTVATQTPTPLYEPAMIRAGLSASELDLRAVSPAEIPELLSRHLAGLFLLRPGLSNLATSATKIGEYLAAGLPVVLNDACGDLHEVVERTRTGVVLRDTSDEAFRVALDRLEELTSDPSTPGRCREVAIATMGVSHCAAVQAEAHRIASRAPGPTRLTER